MYNKLFSKILDSSIWLEPDSTRIVWMTLLASMDEDGFCAYACAANVANRAIVPIDKAEQALKTLESPDPNSADPGNEGRRIERVPGGWMVLNAPKYRELATREKIRESNRNRAQAFRDRKRNGSVTPRNNSSCNQIKSNQSIKNIWSKPDGSDRANGGEESFRPQSTEANVIPIPTEEDSVFLTAWGYYISTFEKNPKTYTATEKRRRMGKSRVRELLQRIETEPKLEKAECLMKLCIDRMKAHPWTTKAGKLCLDWEHMFGSTERMEYWLDDQNFHQVGANKPNGHGGRQVSA